MKQPLKKDSKGHYVECHHNTYYGSVFLNAWWVATRSKLLREAGDEVIESIVMCVWGLISFPYYLLRITLFLPSLILLKVFQEKYYSHMGLPNRVTNNEDRFQHWEQFGILAGLVLVFGVASWSRWDGDRMAAYICAIVSMNALAALIGKMYWWPAKGKK